MTLSPRSPPYQRANEAVHFIKRQLPSSLQAPRVAIICGSGLGGLASTIDDQLRVEIDYCDIPHFPNLTGQSQLVSRPFSI